MLGSRAGLATFFLIALLPLPTRAEGWPIARGPSREPAPYRYDPRAWQGVPKSFLEDSPACTLYSGTTHLVEEDGTVEAIMHEITRFNGRKGIERLGEYRNISYDPAFQQLALNEARVIKANGRFVPIEPRHVQLRDVSTDFHVYDHEKQLIISFPNLEVGDAIEVKWTIRGRNPEYQGHFFTRYNFGDDTYPVVLDELRVRLPRSRELKYATTGGKLEPVVTEDKGLRLYHWHTLNRPALPQDEDLPSREDLRLQVSCSTFGSWDEIGKWKQNLREKCWECTPDVREIVREVIKDLDTPLARARALTYWVRRNVRYVSVGEKHDYTPHAPTAVVGNRYGDCKDQSQLLAVMLREAGVPVALATLGTLGDGQVLESVPSPWGTHAILLVTLDGQDHWIDTTVSLAGWDFLPRDDRDRVCYAVDERGLRLAKTPAWTPADNRLEQDTDMTVRTDGSTYCERKLTYHGGSALLQRDGWVEVPPGERRRLMTAELQDANSRAHLLHLQVDEAALKDYDQPVSGEIAFEVPGQFTGENTREGSITDSKIWARILAFNLDYDRPAALQLAAPFESRHRYVVHLPPAFVFEGLPRNRTIQSKWGSFRVRVKVDFDNPRRLEIEFQTKLDKPLVDPADFDEFRTFHEDLTRHYRVWLTMKPTQDKGDIPALETWLALAPEDSASAGILARLHQQLGRARDARRVVRFARLFKPNDAALAETAVKLAENLAEEEKTYRELVAQFPDEPKYAIGLGTTLINRGEYAKARTVLAPLAEAGLAANQGQAHYQLARSFLLDGDAVQALKHIGAAGLADPDSVSSVAAAIFKARMYEKLGRVKDAGLCYRDALQLEADNSEALIALVRLSIAAKKNSEALDFLRRYTVAVGADADGLLTAAELHLSLERYEDAFELASRVQEKRFAARAQAILGLVHLHRGEYAKAVFHLERAEGGARVLEGLMRSYVVLGRLGDAGDLRARVELLPDPSPTLRQAAETVATLVQRRDLLLKAARIPADDVDLWRNALGRYVCAEQAHGEGRTPAQIEAILKEVNADGVDYGPAHALLGLLALERGRLSQALAEAERALALDATAPGGYYVRGRVRFERGTEGALADLEKAATLSERRDAGILHALAAAQLQAGRPKDALATQREAARLKPHDGAIEAQLKELEQHAVER